MLCQFPLYSKVHSYIYTYIASFFLDFLPIQVTTEHLEEIHVLYRYSRFSLVIYFIYCSVNKSCLTLWDLVNHSMPASLSITSSQSLPKPMSIESVMPSNHLILSCPSPFRLPSFPASRSFPVSRLVISGGQSIEALASASVLPIYFIHNINSLYSVINLVSSRNARRHVCFWFFFRAVKMMVFLKLK